MVTHAGLCIPFALFLGMLTILPSIAPEWWARYARPLIIGYTGSFIALLATLIGPQIAFWQISEILILDYIPFIAIATVLYVLASCLDIRVSPSATPVGNTLFLMGGILAAALMGTLGASVALIRPLLAFNKGRRCMHTILFFIFLVSNIGGILSSLGDPPLFVGFLKGIPFLWPTKHLGLPFIIVAGPVLGLYYALDSLYYRREGRPMPPALKISLEGKGYMLLILGVFAFIWAMDQWNPSPALTLGPIRWPLSFLCRDGGLLTLAFLVAQHRTRPLSYCPLKELVTLFGALFILVLPIMHMMAAGLQGPFAPLLTKINQSGPVLYFWASGILSSFLDNVPTYLLFFQAAGGKAATLVHDRPAVLAAFSLGSVFMGALTYIGNSPNLLVKALAEEQGIKMPTFLRYMGWSIACLGPAFIALTYLYLWP